MAFHSNYAHAQSVWLVEKMTLPAELRVSKFAFLIFLSMVPRLIFMPISFHPWEAQTWFNVGYDVMTGKNPYVRFSELASETGRIYEYWAYPPFFIYILLPFYSLIYPYRPELAWVEDLSPPIEVTPFYANFTVKIPMLLFDFLSAIVIWKILTHLNKSLEERKKIVIIWLFNPLLITISSVWGHFDVVAVFFHLASVYMLMKKKYVVSSVLLTFSILTKPYTIVFLPLHIVYILTKEKRRIYESIRYVVISGVFGVTACLPFIVYGFSDFLNAAVFFHAGRIGGGISYTNVAWLGSHYFNWSHQLQLLYTQIPSFLLPLFLIFAYYYFYKNFGKFDIVTATLILFFGVYIFSKLINEPYTIWALPFFLLLYSKAKELRILYNVFWVIPLVFTSINVPFPNLLRPIIWQYLEPPNYLMSSFEFKYPLLFILGTAFILLCGLSLWKVMRTRGIAPLLSK